jgi:uncharacterized protein
MKKNFLIAFLFILSNSCYSQLTATKDHINTLLEMTGAGKIGVQVMENMIATFRKSMPNVPSDFWDEFLKDAKPETLIELMIPVYAKHYTDEEIVQLIDFYRTPLGKKVIEKLPLISQESYVIGAEWGRKLSEQAIKKLTDKGYMPNN